MKREGRCWKSQPAVSIRYEGCGFPGEERMWGRICFEARFHTSVPHTIDTVNNMTPFQQDLVSRNVPSFEAHIVVLELSSMVQDSEHE